LRGAVAAADIDDIAHQRRIPLYARESAAAATATCVAGLKEDTALLAAAATANPSACAAASAAS
jgi:hypothetical protein